MPQSTIRATSEGKWTGPTRPLGHPRRTWPLWVAYRDVGYGPVAPFEEQREGARTLSP
eukprot:CAMPEP_0180291578 /NCGR_PEP_ID=MMETSP0988-20121125/16216_1 /TAXON_ID=697907 /ORGANISM="non described non described, Strain CCMP2293" /LENGTH=57 /DNA_ID=CAMNT_0022267451 /DNA_START=204 /DNA_END=373 /DNA_ORIENTATION=+